MTDQTKTAGKAKAKDAEDAVEHEAPYPSQAEADAIREGAFNPGEKREAKAADKAAEYQTR